MIARLDSALLLAKAHNKSIAHRVKANSGDEARDTEWHMEIKIIVIEHHHRLTHYIFAKWFLLLSQSTFEPEKLHRFVNDQHRKVCNHLKINSLLNKTCDQS
jgi:hypothetical protein